MIEDQKPTLGVVYVPVTKVMYFASLGQGAFKILPGESPKAIKVRTCPTDHIIVAEGKADIYPRFGPTSEWDTAAAQCVVEQAGGHLTDLQMQPLRYNAKASLINPYFLVFGDTNKNWSHYLEQVKFD